jgi:hypothetical protein
MSPHRVQRSRSTDALITVTGLLAILGVMSYPLLNSYSTAQAQWRSAIAGCLRSAQDNADNAAGWEAARQARMAAYLQSHDQLDLRAAARYADIVRSLESRTRATEADREVFCRINFPKPSLF